MLGGSHLYFRGTIGTGALHCHLNSLPFHSTLHYNPLHTALLHSTPLHTALHCCTPHHLASLQPLQSNLLHSKLYSTPLHTLLLHSTPLHTALKSTPHCTAALLHSTPHCTAALLHSTLLHCSHSTPLHSNPLHSTPQCDRTAAPHGCTTLHYTLHCCTPHPTPHCIAVKYCRLAVKNVGAVLARISLGKSQGRVWSE
jgi:hypothetical protein